MTYELINSLNIEINSIYIILSSFKQNDEVCISPLHPFERLFLSLFNRCILCIIYLIMLYREYSSCSGRHLNLIPIKRDIIFPCVFKHVHCSIIMRYGKILMIIYFYIRFLVPILTYVIHFTCIPFIRGLHLLFDFT